MRTFQLTAMIALTLISCSKRNSSENGKTGERKYLAENIVLGGSNLALADEVDTSTKIRAENVVFGLSKNTSISSANVQGALEEIAPPLKDSIVGRWDVKNYGLQCNNIQAELDFRSDGTWALLSGGFVIGSAGACPDFNGLGNGGTYEVPGNGLIVIKNSGNSETKAVQISGLSKDSFTMFQYQYGAVAIRKK